MINTIFYFPDSLTFDQYLNNLDSNSEDGIARRTIVFARQQGKIYNNGKLFGTTASDVQSLIDETKEYLEGLIDDTKVDFDSLIERIKASLNGVRSDLDNVLSRESDGINQMIEDVINSKGFIDGWQAGWDNNIKAYLIQAGIIDANNIKGWAYLETKYNELKALVNSIDVGDGLTAEIVSSLIDARIEENSSITELKSRYALTNEDKTVLKWLSAGLYSEANANLSLTSVFASAESVATNTRAISGLTTRVSDLEGEDFLTESSLVSEIRKQKGDISTVLSEAGLVNTARLNEATSTLSSRLNSVETTSGDNADAVSALKLSVKNLEDNGAPATESSVISAINIHKNDIVQTLSSAGLVNTATLNSAKSTLQTNIDNVSSRIVSKSEIEEIAGEKVETATAGMVVESDLGDYVKKASIIASINSSGESNVTISADKINLSGDVIAQRLIAANASIGGFSIGNSKLSNSAVEFNADGSGYLANGALQWTNSGGLDINADGLILDVTHNWDWVPNQSYKGLASFGIVGDFSNLCNDASYNYGTSLFIYTPASVSNAKETTRSLANTLGGSMIDASGLGIILFNPLEKDITRLNLEIGEHSSGTYLVASGANEIHPNTKLKAGNFPSPFNLLGAGSSGLCVESNEFINGGLVVRNKAALAQVEATSFKKRNGTSNEMLMADGSVKPLGEINISAGQVSGITNLITNTVTTDYIQTRLSGLNDLLTDSSVRINNQSVEISESNRVGFLGSVFDTLELTDDDITSKHVSVSGNGTTRTDTIRWKLDEDGNARISGNLIVGGKLYYNTSDITKNPDGNYSSGESFDGTEVGFDLSAITDAISDLQDEINNIKTRLKALES